MNTVQEILEQLAKSVDVKRLIDELSFDLDNFEQANLEQPRLYLEAGRYLTWAVLEKARAELKVEVFEADYGSRLRENREEKKLTEKAIEQGIRTNKDYQSLRKRAYLAKTTETWAKQMVEAYNQRLQVIGNITKIRTGEISSELRSAKEKVAVDTFMKKARRMRDRIDREEDDEA